MLKAIIIGEVCEDILMHSPCSVEALGEKIWAEDIRMVAGGSAAYAAIALANMGADVTICSTIGDDERGRRLLQELTEQQVDCRLISVHSGVETTASMVVCDGKNKNFIGCSPMLPISIPSFEQIRDADVLVIAGYMIYPELHSDEAYSLFKEAHDHGIKLLLDGQSLPNKKTDSLIKRTHLDRMLALVDVFFAARKEVKQLLGTDEPEQASKQLLTLGCKLAVLKQGSDGCRLISEKYDYNVPVFSVEVFDTVGAGDIFGAAFSFGFASGWDIKRCSEFASIYTGLSLRRYKHHKPYPILEEVNAAMEAGRCRAIRIR